MHNPNDDTAGEPGADCECGHRLDAGANFCGNCGRPRPEPTSPIGAPAPSIDNPAAMTCECGYSYSRGMSACPRCSAPASARPIQPLAHQPEPPTESRATTSTTVDPKSSTTRPSGWTTGRLVTLAGAVCALLALIIVLATGGPSSSSRQSINLSEETLSYIEGADWPMICSETIRSAAQVTAGRGLTGGADFYAETYGELRGLPQDELRAVFIEKCGSLGWS